MNFNNWRGAVSTAGMTPAEKQASKDAMIADIRAKMAATWEQHQKELDTPTEKDEMWIVYYDHNDTEGASVFYCWVTMAKSRAEAVNKVSIAGAGEESSLDAVRASFVE